MKFDSLVALIALAPLAMADTTKIVSKCYTKLGKTSKANVATSSYALSFTFKVFQTITSTPSTTITPIAATVTTTQVVPSTTTTTLAQVTDTFTNTILETTTQVSTVVLPTITSTIVVTTSVTDSSVTTVAGPVGFVPIRSAYPVARRARSEERSGRFDLRAPDKVKCTFKNGKPVFSPALYPDSVKCGALVNVYKTSTITKTAAKVSTITAPTPTTIIMATSISVITLTVAPSNIQTTVFTTATVISVAMTTITPVTSISSTTTVTEAKPAATNYAACGPNNQASSVNGQGFAVISIPRGTSFTDVPGATPYDCCVSCFTTGGCFGYFFLIRSCTLLQTDNVAQGQCGAPNRGGFSTGGPPDPTVVIGNGPCGQVYQE